MTSLIRFLTFVFVALFATVGFAADVPKLTGVFNDPASIVSPKKRDEITAFLREQEARTSNQIVVLVVKSLDGDTLENFADRVFRSWKLGIAGKDNGVLVLVEIGEHQAHVRIEVGRGLQGALPDQVAYKIIEDNTTENFKVRKFGSGLLGMVQAIDRTIKGEYSPEPKKAVTGGLSTDGLILLIVGLGAFVAIVVGIIVFGGTSSNDDEDEHPTSTPRSNRRTSTRGSSSTRSSFSSRSSRRDNDDTPIIVPVPISSGGGYSSRGDDSPSRSDPDPTPASEPDYGGGGGMNDGGGASASVDIGGGTSGGD